MTAQLAKPIEILIALRDRVELKYCEGCGYLFFRPAGSNQRTCGCGQWYTAQQAPPDTICGICGSWGHYLRDCPVYRLNAQQEMA